jgi:hypothetical protein
VTLPERVRGQKKNMAANWVGHIVNFSVEYACAGICRHFLLRGLFYGANGVSTKKQARQATPTILSVPFFVSFEKYNYGFAGLP